MQISSLKVFNDLVETASFSQAAERNQITQSAVSQQISALEQRFGTTLVERGKKNFSLTQEGLILLEGGRQILAIYSGLDARMKQMQEVVTGKLRVATVYSIGLHELPPYLKAFRHRYPQVELEVEYRRSSKVYSEVLDGNVDLGLVAFPNRKSGLTMDAFWKDKLVLICPPSHRLASRRRVRLKDLAGERFIAFEPDLPTGRAIGRMFRKAGVEIGPAVELDNIETVKRAVEIEQGISIVPQTTVVNETDAGTLRIVEIDEPNMWRPLGVIMKRNSAISPAQKQFLLLLKGEEGGMLKLGSPRRRRRPSVKSAASTKSAKATKSSKSPRTPVGSKGGIGVKAQSKAP